LLDRLRGRLNDALMRVGSAAAAVLPSPTAWTFVGLVFALLAGIAYSLSSPLMVALAGVAILASGFFDVVDGAVARVTASATKRGAFFDSTLDRLGEFIIYAGILLGRLVPPIIVLLALALSLLVSYARAKADSLGYNLAGVGVGERSERLLVLAISSIVGLLYFGVLLVVVLAGFTFVERVYRISISPS
jgi:archaetidylinositol phosphate synthase